VVVFFFSSRRRHTRFSRDWSSDVCSSDLQSRLAWWSLSATQDAYEIRLMRVGAEEKPQVFQPNLGSPTKIPLYFPRWSPDGKKKIGRASCRERVERWVRWRE